MEKPLYSSECPLKAGDNMTIVGFNFNKISAEKKAGASGKINVSNNVILKNIEKAKIAVGTGDSDAIKYSFEFTSQYEPKMGSILLTGDVIAVEDVKTVKEVTENWKKSKTLPPEIMGPLLNNILTKCNIEALLLSKELNLPPPIQLPKIEITGDKKKEKKYIG